MSRRDIFGMPKSRLVPWVVLALGLATTAALYVSIGKSFRRRNAVLFDEEVKRLDRQINAIVDTQVGVLYAAAGAVSANPGIDRSEFKSFYKNLRKGKAASVLTSVGFSMARPWERRSELDVEAFQRGVQGFRINPTTPRPNVLAALLLEPSENTSPDTFGHDMSVDPVRGEAIEAARRTGLPRMTSKIVLSRDRNRPASAFLLYLPVRNESSNEEIGLVHLGLRSRDLFEPLLESVRKDHVGFRLWSGTRRPENVVLEHLADESHTERRVTEVDLKQVGQKIQAEFVALEGFETPSVIRPWVLPLGSVLSLLFFALASVLARAQETSERRESQQKLLAEVGRLTSDAAEDDRILAEIAVAIGKTFDTVCRIDLLEDDGTLRTVNTRQERNEALEALERDYPRLQSDRLLQTSLETGETQRSVNGYIATDDRHRERIEALGVGPVAVVPMRLRDRKIGAITLARSRGRDDFSGDIVVLTEAIAARIALAMDNARLYRAAQGEIRESRTINDELERRVAERTRDLEASNQELESFCYSVSHDLRTPLRSLDGFSRALKEDYGDQLDTQGHDFLDRIRAAAKRMDELITALLTLSRLTRSEILPAPVDVSRVARDLAQDLDTEGRVRFEIADDLKVQGDPRMVEVLVENLLSNAVKFTARTESPHVEVGRTPDGWIFFRDNGAGFDPEYSKKLFQPFERLHSVREFPGHGIGLATVERIVRRHGGEVKAEGKPGEGATFYVRLPELSA